MTNLKYEQKAESTYIVGTFRVNAGRIQMPKVIFEMERDKRISWS